MSRYYLLLSLATILSSSTRSTFTLALALPKGGGGAAGGHASSSSHAAMGSGAVATTSGGSNHLSTAQWKIVFAVLGALCVAFIIFLAIYLVFIPWCRDRCIQRERKATEKARERREAAAREEEQQQQQEKEEEEEGFSEKEWARNSYDFEVVAVPAPVFLDSRY